MSTNNPPNFTRTQELDRLIDQFKDRYGSFESERYLQEERTYKLAFARGMSELIDRDQLRREIDDGKFVDAARRIRRVYKQSGNNLLNTWDRLPLENAPDEALSRGFYDLLYGGGEFTARFDAWAALLSQQNPNCWPAATFFLMLAYPNEHIFVKAVPFRAMLVRLRPEIPWSTRPTAAAYAQILQLARDLYEQLRPLGARDMIDVQSFIWSVQPENERAWIFQSSPEIFDLPTALAQLDRLTWRAKQQHADMRVGDTVYLWESGEDAGILAVATILGEPETRQENGAERAFYLPGAQLPDEERRVPLQIERVLARRLSKKELADHPQLAKMKIMTIPTGTNFKVGETDAVALESLVAAIPTAPKGQRMQQLPPRPLDGPAFVVIHSGDFDSGQTYGESYVFTNRAGGAPRQLSQALLHPSANDDRPAVYLIIYRPYPYHAFTAWARVIEAEMTTDTDDHANDTSYKLKLEHHEFPEPLNLKGNAAHLMSEIDWLSKGLTIAFRGKSIRPISSDVFFTIIDAAYPPTMEVTRYLPLHWTQLADIRDHVRKLDTGPHTIETLHSLAGDLASGMDPETFVETLCWLRLLAPVDGGQYELRDYVAGDPAALLRLMALALLLPVAEEADRFELPAEKIVPLLDGESRALNTFAPTLGADQALLRSWYVEAELIEVTDTVWLAAAHALDDLPGDDAAVNAYNQFLRALQAKVAKEPITLVDADGPIPPVTDLDGALRELATELHIDPAIVRRVYRSLAAGRHVVLSGPPGTGKTELAMRLPKLLWRESPHTFTRLTDDPNKPPTVPTTEQRYGYATELVTATEDWGVRDVVGGIGPQLDENRRLGYTIQHGALTRTVLKHYADTQKGESLPTQDYTRRDYVEDEKRYRGVWLVIDEFTRAPVDAAFGSLLTTLSGGDRATLAVPTAAGAIREVPIPADFRIIGTLNSFDRHFLNQISEALKRRFDFIDVLPPIPQFALQEQGIATMRALRRLRENGFQQIEATVDPVTYRWPTILSVASDGNGAYVISVEDSDAQAALTSLWRIFRVLRYFRQFGTAQLVALLTNLFAGRMIRMDWNEALDTAFADSLADQLQVLTRDEQQIIVHFLSLTGDQGGFTTRLQDMLKAGRTNGRRAAIMRTLRDAAIAHNGATTIDPESEQLPSDSQIQELFDPGTPLALPPNGIFLNRLRNLIGERGL